MITVRMIGGLGNQLFQWAAAVHLTVVHKQRVRFDTSWFRAPQSGDTVRELEIEPLLRSWGGLVRYPGKFADRIYRRPHRWHTVEQDAGGSLSYVRPGWLSGYFQDSRVVGAVGQTVLGELTAHGFVSRDVEESRVALHVRLGDYFHNPHTRAFHGLLPPAYFNAAIKELPENALTKPVRVFTDSPEVFAEHYAPTLAVSYELSTARDAKDVLHQMSSAGHLLISNSSLSWWAGFSSWACRNTENGTVAYPLPWLSQSSHFDNCIAPHGWTPVPRPKECAR